MFEDSASTWPPSGVQREREVLAVRDPEVAVEPPLEVGRLLLQPVGERRVVPDLARQPGAAHLGVVGVALQLAGGAREAGQPCRRDRRSSPRSPSSTGSPGRSARCGARTRCSRRPRGRRTRRSSRSAARASCSSSRTSVASPVQRSYSSSRIDEQRRRVGAAVVGRVRPLLERGHLAVAHLVQDLPGLLVAEVVDAGCPAASPSTRSVVAASSGTNGSACRLVMMLSRPNIVMNQGRPAAGRLGRRRSAARSAARPGRPGCAGRSSAAAPSRTRAAGRLADPAPRGSARMLGGPVVAGRTAADPRPRAAERRVSDVEVGRPLAVRLDAGRSKVSPSSSIVAGVGRRDRASRARTCSRW